MRGTRRLVVALVTVVVALLLEVTVFPHFAWDGVVPDLVLLTVVGAALVTDPRFATLMGFFAGLLLDVTPPADHVAGRWALALMAVGYVVGRLAHDHQLGPAGSPGQPRGARPSYPLMVVAGAGGAFIGTTVFAVTGLLLREPAVGFGDLLEVVLSAVAYDALVAVVLLPLTVWIFTREPGQRPGRVTPRLPRRAPV